MVSSEDTRGTRPTVNQGSVLEIRYWVLDHVVNRVSCSNYYDGARCSLMKLLKLGFAGVGILSYIFSIGTTCLDKYQIFMKFLAKNIVAL